MSPLYRKEIKLLLPAWIGALLSATSPLWLPHELWIVSAIFICAAILALALSPFGLENSYGTFALLLVQPEERRRFWRIKTQLLAFALVTAWILFAVCLRDSQTLLKGADQWFLPISAGMALLAFSGGLWSTLLLREMVSAFFCTWMVPALIWMALLASLSHWLNPESGKFIIVLLGVLAAYTVAGFLWARHLFLEAQEIPWTGGQISLSSGRGIHWLGFEIKNRQNRWAILVKKELRLQEITLFLIPALLLLHLAGVALHLFNPERISRDLCYAIPLIWMISVPIVTGCVAVAEERRLNTLESLLCLPVTKREQFAMKLVVTLVVGIVLGGIIPWGLLKMTGFQSLEIQYAVAIAAVLTGISFYGSTMSRGLLQALPATFCISFIIGLGMTLGQIIILPNRGPDFIPVSLLFPAIILPVMAITFVWLAFDNYKRLQIDWRVRVENLIRAGAVAVCVTLVSLGIFNRLWQLFLPLEPVHGLSRITGAGRTSMAFSAHGLYVLLPDGRLWAGTELSDPLQNVSDSFMADSFKGVSGVFIEGSNWTQVAAGYQSAITLQSDGTLWKISSDSEARKIGSDSDWKTIAAGAEVFLALKQNGSIYGWGNDGSGIIAERTLQQRETIIAEPVLCQSNSEWLNVFLDKNGWPATAIKRDGSTWRWGKSATGGAPWHTPVRWKMGGADGTTWLSMANGPGFTLQIRTDGSLWANGNVTDKIFGKSTAWSDGSARVGTNSDWLSVSGNYWQLTALEANGAIWSTALGKTRRPSKYFDWIAAAQDDQFTWGLAKDGTLTCWDEFSVPWRDESIFTAWGRMFFLGPNRRPVFSGNILLDRQL